MKYYTVIRCISFFLLFLVIISLEQLSSSLFSIDCLTYAIDSLVAESTQQDIITYVQQIPENRSLSFQELAYKIQKQFSFIHETTIEHLAPGIVYIACNAQKPLYIINNSLILTEQGYLYNKNIFLSLTIKQLPHITLPSLKKNIILSLVAIINNIEPIVFSQFTLSWINDTKICLYDKKQRQFSIIFNKNQLPNKKLLQHCAYIKQRLQAQKEFTNTKKHYVADIRFEDQIVVYGA